MKDMDTIEFITENKERNLHLLLGVRLRNGKLRLGGGVRTVDLDKVHSQTTRFSFKLPTESAWERLKPNELTLKFPPLTAKWNLKGA